MRITHEADYAIRVTYCLALAGEKQCAKDISEVTGVTLRFALKILRKLTQSGITKSYKGVAGGYELNHSPSEISLGAIIECIDGPIAINHCLANEFQCTHMGTQKECDFHRVFSEINRSLRDQLCSITMDRFLYLFGELYVIMVLRFTPRISRERRWTRWPIFSHFWYLSEQM